METTTKRSHKVETARTFLLAARYAIQGVPQTFPEPDEHKAVADLLQTAISILAADGGYPLANLRHSANVWKGIYVPNPGSEPYDQFESVCNNINRGIRKWMAANGLEE